MLNRTRIVACTVPVVMTLACSGADGVRSRRASSSISPVVNCEAVDDSDLLVDQANALFDPQYVEPRPAPAPKMGERMGSGWLQDGGPLDAFPTLDAGANDPASVSVRHRAAILCACRARSHRSWARTDGKWSDALTVVGAVGTIGGGAVNSVAATGLEDDTRRALLTSGILTMGSRIGGLCSQRRAEREQACGRTSFGRGGRRGRRNHSVERSRRRDSVE